MFLPGRRQGKRPAKKPWGLGWARALGVVFLCGPAAQPALTHPDPRTLIPNAVSTLPLVQLFSWPPGKCDCPGMGGGEWGAPSSHPGMFLGWAAWAVKSSKSKRSSWLYTQTPGVTGSTPRGMEGLPCLQHGQAVDPSHQPAPLEHLWCARLLLLLLLSCFSRVRLCATP